MSKGALALRRKAHQTVRKITESLETGQFNTPVASLMELSNALADLKAEPEDEDPGDSFAVSEAVRFLILMLAPYAPHTAEELWESVTGSTVGIVESGGRFPVADEEVAKESEVEIAVQVNGKLRSKVQASAGADNETLEELARADGKIMDHTNGKEIIKVIVVPNRLVNIVVKG